jgi:hypothetical protein
VTHKVLCFGALVVTIFIIASDSLSQASAAVETSQSVVVERPSSGSVSTATFGINIWLWMSFGLAAFVSAATLLFLDARGILPRRAARRKATSDSQDEALSVAT